MKNTAKTERAPTGFDDRLAVISERKLKANRENAKKSTGPRTLRGKEYSRRNAIKHGLFARAQMDFFLQNETWSEYEALFKDLRDYYKPLGRAEELEVERIAQSWWRLKRADRYENAANQIAIRDLERNELADPYKFCDECDDEEKAYILKLQELSDEIKAGNQPPTDWRERLIAIWPKFAPMWQLIERVIEQYVAGHPILRRLRDKVSPEERSEALPIPMITVAQIFIQHLGESRRLNVRHVAYDQHAIPNDESLGRLLRYEAAIDRNLNRALDRLERLQSQRRGLVR